MNTKAIGDVSTSMVTAFLLRKGETVLTPFGDKDRYDLVIDRKGSFFRIQCKTGRLKNGVITFNACSINIRTSKRENYRDQIEFFGVYCPDNHGIYLVPVYSVPLTTGSLRVDPSKNNQQKGVLWAKEFEI